jgi:thiol-disulfide isomerase/thioredoxin
LGKVVLLNFWGTWCGPCKVEIPDFNKLYKEYKKDGLEIVGVTLGSGTANDIASFANKWEMEYLVLADISQGETDQVQGLFSRAIGQPIYAIPTTFLIDREGYIVKGYLGPRTHDVFLKDLKPYL